MPFPIKATFTWDFISPASKKLVSVKSTNNGSVHMSVPQWNWISRNFHFGQFDRNEYSFRLCERRLWGAIRKPLLSYVL